MANVNPISSQLRLSLNSTEGGKTVTRYVTLSKLSTTVTAETLDLLADSVATLLAHSVSMVRKVDTGQLVK